MQEILAIATIALLGAMSPGPDFVIVSKNSLKYNSKIGFYTALGVGLGIMVHVTYILIGIGVLVSKSILLYSIIKYLGAFYLIYLGCKAVFSKGGSSINMDYDKSMNSISISKAFKEGFLTNALNPKATVFFLSIFTQVITPETAVFMKWGYGVEMALIVSMWFSLMAFVLGNKYVRLKVKKWQKYVDKFMGAVLVLLGLKIAVSKN
jgi:RhtB (resistance to homoserine/threonine) family protein